MTVLSGRHHHGGGPATGAPRRPRTAVRALALALALTGSLAATGCGVLEGDEPERYTRACGVVLDGSGSGATTKTGFDARAKLKGSLERFLTGTGCGTLAFAPITQVSQSSKCQANQLELDPDLPGSEDREYFRGELRADALKEAGKLLTCAQRQSPGSDVVGGLARIAMHRPDSGKGSFAVLVVSDFEQNDPEFSIGKKDLSTEGGRAKAIGELLAAHGSPPLAGMDIYPVGYGMKHRTKTSFYEQFDAFWTELLEGRLKADVHTTYR
ncbi:hypothetical protein [Streptomyces yaizuensis]|uniref:VWA domain-containing protein n=1 Tax=Streptomyces yaizuensis TaxID=2989713 RepID=A0ABQ5P273_9ACTN|nr:hypothetical protein [Streptomyces sp. YSPA8]GLF96575.1 hypothetical protein SYYSPA8_19780 [Streptomyces sp. YSPA8]